MFFKKLFNKMGHWHVRQLVRQCTDEIISASMREFKQKGNQHLTDSALDFLINSGGYRIMEEKSYANLQKKFSEYVSFFVVRNLGREFDWVSGEGATLNEEIEKYWPVFATTKDGTQQKIRECQLEAGG